MLVMHGSQTLVKGPAPRLSGTSVGVGVGIVPGCTTLPDGLADATPGLAATWIGATATAGGATAAPTGVHSAAAASMVPIRPEPTRRAARPLPSIDLPPRIAPSRASRRLRAVRIESPHRLRARFQHVS